MARRAFAVEDKLARRDVILEAARALFMAGDGDLPSAAQIAEAAGLAKGTVYLYFRSKEEIFAALLLAGWSALLAEVGIVLSRSQDERTEKIAAFLATYVSYLHAHPELLRLDALGYGVLEQNMGAKALGEFKLSLTNRLTKAGIIADAALDLPEGQGFRLLMRTYALTRGLWQSTKRDVDTGLVTAELRLAPLYPNFDEELPEALKEYWRGALMA